MAWRDAMNAAGPAGGGGGGPLFETNGVGSHSPTLEASPRGPYHGTDGSSEKAIKYLVVTGGTMSGLGKGTTISSIGVTLKALGLRVTAIKVDPYLNVDAGTMSPYEHGEVYVLEDGGEVDLDLGNYERFLDVTLSKVHNLTSGKLFQSVLSSERRGAYLGKTVQVVPQVTDAVQQWLARVARLPVEDHIDTASSGSNSNSNTRSSSNSNTSSSTGNNNNSSNNGNSDTLPDVCLVEVGGTVGDIESALYLEALQQFCRKVGPSNFCLCHVSYVPTVSGEQKTKPTQHGVKELRMAGLKPDMIFCRCETMLCESSRAKIALFSQVLPEHVISVHDVSNTYRVPQVLHEQGVAASICKLLQLEPRIAIPRAPEVAPPLLQKWMMMADRLISPRERVRIGVVGKYTGLADSYLSVVKALQHGAMEAGVLLDIIWIESSELERKKTVTSGVATSSPVTDASSTARTIRAPIVPHNSDDSSATSSSPTSGVRNEKKQEQEEEKEEKEDRQHNAAWEMLRSVQGVVCPGGFGDRGINGKAASAGYCRRSGVPYLGICLGMQTAVIDFARDVLQLEDANSEEFDPRCAHPVVVAMPEHTSATQSDVGGTMRLGKRATIIRDPTSLAARLYDGKPVVDERHRHRYEINPLYVKALEAKGLTFVGQNERGQRMEIAELQGHPFFLCVQYHPEFTSRPLRPSPLFLGLILAAAGKLQDRLKTYNGFLRSGATYEQLS